MERMLRELGDPARDSPRNPAALESSSAPEESGPDRSSEIQGVAGTEKDSGGGDDALRDLYVPARTAVDDLGGEPTDVATAMNIAGTLPDGELATFRRLVGQSGGKPEAEVLLEMGIVEHLVQAAVAERAGIPFLRLTADVVDPDALQRLGVDFCKQRLVIPLRSAGSRTIVGTSTPDDVFLIDDVKRRLGVSAVRHALVCASEISTAIESIDRKMDSNPSDVDAILADVEDEDVEAEEQDGESKELAAEAESSPVVRYVNHIIQTALAEGASDIHIEPGETMLRVRLRIDGILFEMMTPPRKLHGALTSRIKIMANLDIAERRLPQDGRIRTTVAERKLDLRVSTVPTSHGEKTVMRILDDRAIQVSLDELGFESETLAIWKKQIEQPHGIILVTGPTGSGKTTTLYSSLRQMDMKRLNISTVEDPVEYALDGVTQIQTHNAIDMSFGRALKALLRQDPDVVMVGEIRDHETASIAVQAALTGHLVLSTLHTNDAPSSITRLINVGVEPFLVGAALNGVLAQRLVRRVCSACSRQEQVPADVRESLALQGFEVETLSSGKGCDSCRQTGYSGRLGLYELLMLDDHLRDLVASNPNVTDFRRTCRERGMVTLREDGFRKVAEGRTTVEEVLRVTEANH
jgi:type IV pilus assembly protein PilB